ncbi:MAG: SprT family zinc-dependent metalloprotease [Paracoccaceae bacterium]|nr:SprT family zinc-dependent metalloprotease [Paracoccaceae bacterium]
MAELTLAGDPPISMALKRSSRARRLTLRVSALDGRVTLTVPAGVPEREALAFARSREAWLRRHLGSVEGPVAVGDGTVIPVEGVATRVRVTPGRVTHGAGEMAVPSVTHGLSYLKELARDRLTRAVDRHAAALERPVAAIALRDPRSRWGSCSSAGRLMFSWRLVLAPPSVLDYVAAHEVAHLKHMDHSPAFWQAVAALRPDYAGDRGWLRKEGPSLHRWQFGG